MSKVSEEMARRREEELRCQADTLATQMATVHYQKAESRARVVETSRALLTLHSLLVHQLRGRKSLERGDVSQSIHSYCLVGDALSTNQPPPDCFCCLYSHCGSLLQSLEEAEHHLQKEKTQLVESHRPLREESDDGEEENLFLLQHDSRMSSILQEALYKRNQVHRGLQERWAVISTRSGATRNVGYQAQTVKM